MRPSHRPVLQRLVASLVLVGIAATLAPVGAARAVRARVLDGVLDDPVAVRQALAASDGAASPDAAVALFVQAYADATGETIAPEDVSALVLGQSLRPVAPPEVKLISASSGTSGPAFAASAVAADRRAASSGDARLVGPRLGEPVVLAAGGAPRALQPRAP